MTEDEPVLDQMQPMVPRPIEGSIVHFRVSDRCMAGIVVDVVSDDPLSPDFKLDLAVFQPRQQRKDRFVNNGTVPGTVRWANNCVHSPVLDNIERTWHYPGRACLPEVVLSGASS